MKRSAGYKHCNRAKIALIPNICGKRASPLTYFKLFAGVMVMFVYGQGFAQSCNTPIPLNLSGISSASPNVTNVPLSGTVTFNGTLTDDNSTVGGIPSGLVNGALRL